MLRVFLGKLRLRDPISAKRRFSTMTAPKRRCTGAVPQQDATLILHLVVDADFIISKVYLNLPESNSKLSFGTSKTGSPFHL